MKANELRIGNLVNRLGETTKITAIQTIGVGGIGYVSTLKSGAITTSQIEPIPLTEEILLKCGFEIDYKFGSMPSEDTEYTIYRNNSIAIGRDKNWEWYRWNEIDDDNWYSGFVGKEIQYLHQLQNIYFALIEEELKIEL